MLQEERLAGTSSLDSAHNKAVNSKSGPPRGATAAEEPGQEEHNGKLGGPSPGSQAAELFEKRRPTNGTSHGSEEGFSQRRSDAGAAGDVAADATAAALAERRGFGAGAGSSQAGPARTVRLVRGPGGRMMGPLVGTVSDVNGLSRGQERKDSFAEDSGRVTFRTASHK